MNNDNLKCRECGKPLEPSQYAGDMRKDGTEVKMSISLVCRNYPDCSKAEKEVNK